MSEKLESIINSIAELSVLELSELVKALEEKFGVTAAAPMAMAAMPMAAAGGGEAAGGDEGPTSFDVVLKEHGSQKIAVIKKVKDMAGLGLKEAKDLVDACPKPVKQGIPQDEANKLKEDLESVGAVVEVVGAA
ncbi:MAG TPA: 50S ribosomal protein L7/L12 [Candidatus Hydrogenedentes bacterium]|mgnify:FL=1|nr:50S ribosomal protein L7/L12 [Candidatus Hydrogenedentota bacterium]